MSGHDDFITCIALSREGHLIASGQQGNCADVLLWDVDTREVHAGENWVEIVNHWASNHSEFLVWDFFFPRETKKTQHVLRLLVWNKKFPEKIKENDEFGTLDHSVLNCNWIFIKCDITVMQSSQAPRVQFRPLFGKTERQMQSVLRQIWTQLAPNWVQLSLVKKIF